MTHWHPLFAQLLRPVLERYYEVRTDVAVGDRPRQADVVVLRRTSSEPPPFAGLWRWLTAWNVLEFKGPSVSARLNDVDDLLEVGFGIHRRLQEGPDAPKNARSESSLWFLANHLGKRFLAGARDLAGSLDEVATGIWRTTVWQHPLFLVSNRDLAVEPDSLPVHLLTVAPIANQREVAQVLRTQSVLWEKLAGVQSALHPELLKELMAMAKTRTKGLHPDFRAMITFAGGWQEFLRQAAIEDLIDEGGLKVIIDRATPAQRKEMVRLLNEAAASPRSKDSQGE